MIFEEIKKIKSTKKEVVQFGLVIGVVLGLLGVFLWTKEKDYFIYFIIFSLILIFTGLIIPFYLKPFYKVWMASALVLGWIITRIILFFLFYLIVTPTGFLMKIFNKDQLKLKFKKDFEKSYWINKKDNDVEKSEYESQY